MPNFVNQEFLTGLLQRKVNLGKWLFNNLGKMSDNMSLSLGFSRFNVILILFF